MKVEIGKRVLSDNDRLAEENARTLADRKLVGVNILASPGAGKTSCILRTLELLKQRNLSAGVIEGDVASSIDTEKVKEAGYPAVQINTDGGCHLSAKMVADVLGSLDVQGPGFVFIENIGNLICPAGYRLGESLTVAIASVPEGDDKPVKYPAVFSLADAIILNKMDIMPHINFRSDFFLGGVRAVNEDAPVFNVSCKTGEGFAEFVEWLASRR